MSCCALRLFFLSKCCRGQNNIINIIMLYLYYNVFLCVGLVKIIITEDKRSRVTWRYSQNTQLPTFSRSTAWREATRSPVWPTIYQSAPSHSLRQVINCTAPPPANIKLLPIQPRMERIKFHILFLLRSNVEFSTDFQLNI